MIQSSNSHAPPNTHAAKMDFTKDNLQNCELICQFWRQPHCIYSTPHTKKKKKNKRNWHILWLFPEYINQDQRNPSKHSLYAVIIQFFHFKSHILQNIYRKSFEDTFLYVGEHKRSKFPTVLMLHHRSNSDVLKFKQN